jgi:hypothetical protein
MNLFSLKMRCWSNGRSTTLCSTRCTAHEVLQLALKRPPTAYDLDVLMARVVALLDHRSKLGDVANFDFVVTHVTPTIVHHLTYTVVKRGAVNGGAEVSKQKMQAPLILCFKTAPTRLDSSAYCRR